MTRTQEAAMRQALEALEKYRRHLNLHGKSEAERALKAALAEPVQEPTDWEAVAADQAMTIALLRAEPVQDPVAWRITDGEGDWEYRTELPEDWSIQWSARYGRKYEPLYTAPPASVREAPQRKLEKMPMARPLTDELMDCVDRLGSEADLVDPRVWDHLLVYAPKAEPVQEPVAWLTPRTLDSYMRPDLGYETSSKRDYGAFPVYTTPPQRKPLTEDQLDDIAVAARRGNLYDLRIAIERAHGITE